MATDSDLVCTITLTSGSKDFTIAGASLVTADIQPGDEINLPLKGLTLTIGEVLTATTGKLTDNCPAAAAGAAQAARLRYQSDLSRAAAKFENLATLLGNGNVDALAGLTLAANKGIHANGLNTLGTHDLTAFARTLLASADAGAMRGVLEVPATGRAGADQVTAGSSSITAAATTDLGSAASVYVNVSGAATITSFGSGSPGAVRFVTFSGNPILVHSGALTLPGNADIATEGSDTAVFVCNGGASWRCLSYTRRGASPGGISYGTVSGAHWLRLGGVSGVQLCWGKHTRSGVPANLSSPTFFRTASQGRNFPAAFASADVSVGVFVFPSTSGQYDIWASQAVAQSGTTMSYVVLSGTSRASIDWTEYWWALGRY